MFGKKVLLACSLILAPLVATAGTTIQAPSPPDADLKMQLYTKCITDIDTTRWKAIGTNSQGDVYYYDSNTVSPNGGYKSVWTITCLSNNTVKNAVIDDRFIVKIKSRDFYDCNSNKYKNVEAMLYDMDDQVIGTPYITDDWKSVPPESLNEKLSNTICAEP